MTDVLSAFHIVNILLVVKYHHTSPCVFQTCLMLLILFCRSMYVVSQLEHVYFMVLATIMITCEEKTLL